MLRRIFRSVKSSFRCFKWSCQAFFERKKIKMRNVGRLDEQASYMILIPHADDEWIGCSQLIRKMKMVFLVDADMVGGDSPCIHSERKCELRKISEMFNRPLSTLGIDKARELSQIIKSCSPDYILVPFFYDWHPEHIMVMDILEQVLKDEKIELNVLMYQVSVPIGKKWVNRVMPMCWRELREKWNVFKSVYITQRHLPYFRFAMHECVGGFLSRTVAAEVFVQMNVEEWMNLKSKVVVEALKEKELIAANLNNISKMRALVDR